MYDQIKIYHSTQVSQCLLPGLLASPCKGLDVIGSYPRLEPPTQTAGLGITMPWALIGCHPSFSSFQDTLHYRFQDPRELDPAFSFNAHFDWSTGLLRIPMRGIPTHDCAVLPLLKVPRPISILIDSVLCHGTDSNRVGTIFQLLTFLPATNPSGPTNAIKQRRR